MILIIGIIAMLMLYLMMRQSMSHATQELNRKEMEAHPDAPRIIADKSTSEAGCGCLLLIGLVLGGLMYLAPGGLVALSQVDLQEVWNAPLLPEVPHDAPHRQRQRTEQAYPTPQHSFSTQGKTHGEIAREEAKRIREERNRQFWAGR